MIVVGGGDRTHPRPLSGSKSWYTRSKSEVYYHVEDLFVGLNDLSSNLKLKSLVCEATGV